MKFANQFLAKVKRFASDTTASMVMIFGAAAPVVIVTGGVGLDMLNVQMKENAATATMNSIGAFASALNTCTGKTGTDLQTCATNLQNSVNSYLTSIGQSGQLSVGVTTGYWCNGTTYSTTGCSSNQTSVPAVQVQGTLSVDTKFLRLFGAATINKGILMTMVDDKITSIAGADICPAFALDDRVLVHPTAGRVTWDDKTNSARLLTQVSLSDGIGKSQSLNSETGTISLSNPYYLIDTGGGGRTTWASRETTSSNSTTAISPITAPTASDFDLGAAKTYTVISYNQNFSASPSYFGKQVNDSRYGLVPTSDSGAPQMLKNLKMKEGSNCLALVVKDLGNGTVKVVGAHPVHIDTVCDGKRTYSSGKFNAKKPDGVTNEPNCSYDNGNTDRVDITIKYHIGEDRNDDSDPWTPSDKSKHRGQSKGNSSNGYMMGMIGQPNRVEEQHSYR